MGKFELKKKKPVVKKPVQQKVKEPETMALVPYTPVQLWQGVMLTKLGFVLLFQARQFKRLCLETFSKVAMSLNCLDLFTVQEQKIIACELEKAFLQAIKLARESNLTRQEIKDYILERKAGIEAGMINSLKLLDLE